MCTCTRCNIWKAPEKFFRLIAIIFLYRQLLIKDLNQIAFQNHVVLKFMIGSSQYDANKLDRGLPKTFGLALNLIDENLTNFEIV